MCDDILTDGKSQSCARDEAIEFDKTFKDIFLHFRLYPGSCVFYIKFHFFFPYFISDGDISLKSEFYGISYEIYQYLVQSVSITDEEIIVKVLESIDEYYNEGKTQGICVFGSGYYKKADTLILSARIGDEIIETVEVDLRTLEVVQCHGKHNQDTEYHERIIDLVNKNANLIRERMKAA